MTSEKLKGKIKSFSEKSNLKAQEVLQMYFFERFLTRLEKSRYRVNFIIKGGFLISSIIGIQNRTTMDIDTTIKGETLGIDEVERMIANIIAVPVDDSVEFHIKRTSQIMDEAEYPGVRVSMETEFDGVRTPLKIDISTGDVITPHEVRYSFKLMLENRSIDIWAYNLETVLAEKLETVISRATTNTRMRDFYDLYILHQLYGRELIPANLHMALMATAKKRGTEKYLSDAAVVFDEVEADFDMEKQWKSYQKKFPYAADLSWKAVMTSVRDIYKRSEV